MDANKRKSSVSTESLWSPIGKRLGVDLGVQATTSLTPAPGIFSPFRNPPTQVNESLYELHKPAGTPSMEILFFHGLQFDESAEDPLWTTWESVDKSCIWPEAWLAEDFPKAHILFISYDGAVKRSSQSSERPDIYIITENLISDLIEANIGQNPNCPLIMVGHCVGGIVIKNLCLQAQNPLSRMVSRLRIERIRLQTFLGNVKGMFYYDTPHHGTPVLDKANVKENPLLAFFQILSKEGERLNFEFGQLRESYAKWRSHGLGASCPPKSGLFKNVVMVPEPFGREGDCFNVMETDHYTICKPLSRRSRSFYALKQLLNNIASDSEVVHLCHGLGNYVVGLEKPLHDIQGELANAKVLGIVGMGGVEKTTIAKSLFNKISRDFEFTCFVDNVKGIKIHELEDWLLKHFYHNGAMIPGDRKGWSNLKDKKTLIVMDDVDSELQLKVLPNLDHFGKDSRLVITSRDRDILKVCANHVIHDVDVLEAEEAKELFCEHLFGSIRIPDHTNGQLEKNIKRVVDKCQGLPLTLEVMGCYLQGHVKEAWFWEETIDKLGEAQAVRGGPNDRVWASLRVSYNAAEEQEMFIDAGTFFFEKPLEDALGAWSTAYKNSGTMWANLLSTSMVKEGVLSGGRSTLFRLEDRKGVWVHEQLRDLAKHLAMGTVISVTFENGEEVHKIVDHLKANGETKILEISAVNGGNRTKRLRADLLDGLHNLKYLVLGDVGQEWSCKNFPNKLSLLIWTIAYNGFFPLLPITPEQITNVAVLELEEWEVSKDFSESLGKLINLRILRLSFIRGLYPLPGDIGNLSRLKQLVLNFNEWRPGSYSTLPDSFGNLSALEHLHIGHLGIPALPESFGNLSSVVTLYIGGCHKLATLPSSFGRLSSLKELTISGFKSLKHLPHSFSQLPQVQLLDFSGGALEKLGDSFGNLSTLRKLTLHRCPFLEPPGSFGLLSMLEHLFLQDCEKFKRFPDNFGQLLALKRLYVLGIDELEALPDNLGLLTSLHDVRVESFNLLERLPESIGELASLQNLKIRAPCLKALPTSLGNLSSLENLSISAAGLQNLPKSIGQLHSLRELALYVKGVCRLPEELGDLSVLSNAENSRRRVARPPKEHRAASFTKGVDS